MLPDFSGFDKRLQELIDIQRRNLEMNHAILIALKALHEDLEALKGEIAALREQMAKHGLP